MGKREYLTKQHRRRIAKARKGFKHSQATKNKISKMSKGHKLTDETRRRMSEAERGSVKTSEHRRKLSESLKRYNRLNPRGRKKGVIEHRVSHLKRFSIHKNREL